MTRYAISFPSEAMDHIPAEAMPAVGEGLVDSTGARDQDVLEVLARPPACAPVDVAAQPSLELQVGSLEDLRIEIAPIVDDDEHRRVRP